MAHRPIAAALTLIATCLSGCNDAESPKEKNSASQQPTSQQPTSQQPTSQQPTSQQPTSQQPATLLTFENFKKINDNTTREDIVALFGPPRKVDISGAEVAQIIHGDASWGVAYESDFELEKPHRFLEALTYSNSTSVLVIAVIKDGNINPAVADLQGKVQTALMIMRKGPPQSGTIESRSANRDLGGKLRFEHTSEAARPLNRRNP